jgi:hypothetical protein
MSFDDHIHDENCDHDEDGDGDGDVEFEVNIDPNEDALDKLGIDPEEFETALYAALETHGDSLEAGETGDVSNTLEELAIHIGGKSYRLGDLASVSIDEAVDDDEDE